MHTRTAPTAQEIMTVHLHCISPEMQLKEMVAFLLKHKISNAPVVKQDGNRRDLMGFVSEADCLEFLANEMFYGNPSPTQTAETIMKKHPTCIGPDADIFAMTSVFMSHRFRHLPVVDSDYHLLGIVSRRDLLRSLDRFYDDWNRASDRERFPVDVHKIMNHRFIMTGQ